MSDNNDVNLNAEEDFMLKLAKNLGNTTDKSANLRILKTVLHSLRDSIAKSESEEYLSRLSYFLQEIYKDGWSYSENEDREYDVGDFKDLVKQRQSTWPEGTFGKDIPTVKLIKKVLAALDDYTLKGEEDTVNTAILIAYCIE